MTKMKRFLIISLVMLAVCSSSLSIISFAGPQTGESTLATEAPDGTVAARKPGASINSTGSQIGYDAVTGYDSEEAMREGMGDEAKLPSGGSNTVPPGSPFNIDVTKPAQPQVDALVKLAKENPDKFIEEVAKARGVPEESIRQDIKNGNYPMITLSATANVTWPDGTSGKGVDTYDAIAKMAGMSKAEIKELTKGGKDIGVVMNELLAAGKITKEMMGAATYADPSDGKMGFICGYLTGQMWNGTAFVPYNLESLAKFGEMFGRDSEMYFNLMAILNDTPDIDTPTDIPTPEKIPEVKLQWKSTPHGYGEIKNKDYSVGRRSEDWEAMAGVPHDETLYYDAGASNISAEFKAKAPIEVLVPTPPSSLTSTCTHEYETQECCSGHSIQVCKWCGKGSSSCGQADTCSDEDGGTYACCSRSDCSHPNSGHESHTLSLDWQTPRSMTNYFPIESYDVLEVKSVNEILGYLEKGSLNLDAAQMASIVEHLEQQGKWGGWPGTDLGSIPCHLCKAMGYGAEFESKCQNWLDKYKETPLITFTTDYLTIKDRDGKTYKVWKKYDINIYISEWSGEIKCGGGIKINLKGGNNPTESVGVGKNEVMDYVSKWTQFHGWEKTNFLPAEESWQVDHKFVVCGYNGDWNNDTRRNCSKHQHLFYEDNLKFTDRIVNGEKTSGPGTVTFVDVPSGKYGGTSVATRTAPTEYEMNYGHVNNVVVHSPVSIDNYYITRSHFPLDQRTDASLENINEMYITPSLNFFVQRTVEWSKNPDINDRGIAQTTEKKGNGYVDGLDTERWIESVHYRFPFEVIYLGDSVRYSADEWITIPVTEYKSEFTLPVSEDEAPSVQYDVVIIAKNSPFRGDPQAAWDEEAEKDLNFHRDCGCQGGLEAPHGAKMWNTVDILGLIGNFTIDYSPDPNWSMFFSQKVVPEKWIVKNIIPEVNPKAYNKFLGPHHDIFDRMWWQIKEEGGRGFATDRWPHGLDSYTSIPHYSQGHVGGILPAAPGKNLESVQDLLQFEPIKMGYPVWWSIETIGNYGTSVARLQVHPKFYLFDTKATTPGAKQVDVYAKVGSSYQRIHDAENRTESSYKLNYSTKLTHDERRLGQVEKDLTKLVVGSGDYSDMFNPANVRWLGTPNEMILTKTLRTFFGTQTFELANHQPNATSNGTPLSHAEQAQRWHGTLLVPSSAKFTEPGKKDFIDTKDKYLMVVLEFTTLDANPWNIETEGSLSVGSNKEVYFPWFEYKTPDRPKETPPEHTVNIPPDTVVVFDPNNPSLVDVQIHGTY